MKYCYTFFISVLIVFNSFSQTHPKFLSNTFELGQNVQTQTPLMAYDLRCELPIYKYHYDLENQSLFVEMRKKGTNDLWKNAGKMLLMNPLTKDVKWSKKVKYDRTGIIQKEGVLFEQHLNKLVRLDMQTGNPIWTAKIHLARIYPEFNLFLGYLMKSGQSKNLHGFDMPRGQSMWTRTISGEFPWGFTEMRNDSVVMIESSGLHSLNLQNGHGWSVDGITHADKVDMGKVGVAVLGAVTMATLGGGIIPLSYSKHFQHISSNVLYEQDFLFFATKDRLFAQGFNGELLWEKNMSDLAMSKSFLFKSGELLYLINTGYAINQFYPHRFGKPFIASYNPETGEQLSFTSFQEQKGYIADFIVQEENILLMFQDKIETFDLATHQIVDRNGIKIDQKSQLLKFIADHSYLKLENQYLQMSQDSTHYYVVCKDATILKLDNQFSFLEKVNKEDVFFNYYETEGFKFLGNTNKTLILNKVSAQIVADISIPFTAKVQGNQMLFPIDNGLRMVDIRAFQNSEPVVSYP
jgi:outer membrane protein assembly factor BamB